MHLNEVWWCTRSKTWSNRSLARLIRENLRPQAGWVSPAFKGEAFRGQIHVRSHKTRAYAVSPPFYPKKRYSIKEKYVGRRKSKPTRTQFHGLALHKEKKASWAQAFIALCLLAVNMKGPATACPTTPPSLLFPSWWNVSSRTISQMNSLLFKFHLTGFCHNSKTNN